MTFVDGVVMAVPTVNREAFREHAEKLAHVFKANGALSIVECWGDDVPDGVETSFPLAVKCKPDETVCFAWVVWPSREARDQGMEKSLADPMMDMAANPLPFDGQRMIFGGFQAVVEV